MEQLRYYLATLTPAEQVAFARRAGTTLSYLRKALCIRQRFGGVLARRLDEASAGAVSRHALRPDIFGQVPELVESEASNGVSRYELRLDGFGNQEREAAHG